MNKYSEQKLNKRNKNTASKRKESVQHFGIDNVSGLQLSPQPLRGLLPISLLCEQRRNGCDQFTIRYDTRCYFNVRSKANTSQLNLPHGTDN